MKHNVLYEDLTFEQVSLLDEACKIYPNLSEVRKKSPNTYKDFEKMYEEMKKMKESENDKSADVSNINKSG